MHEDELKRIVFAIQQLARTSVKYWRHAEWINITRTDGSVTKLNSLPDPYKSLGETDNFMLAVASGQINSSPGFDVVRHDSNDGLTPINIDGYEVIESLPDSPIYRKVLVISGVIDSESMSRALKEYIFVIGPKKPSDHWSEKIPDRIFKYREL